MGRGPCALAMAMAVGTLSAGTASDMAPEVRAVLMRDLTFSAGDVTDLERGKIVKHTLGTNTPGEVAAAAAVRVAARKERLVEQYRDVTHFKRGPEIVQIGKFSTPPALEDLATLTVTHEDLDLRDCRVGDCDVRLPEEAIRRLRHDIDWNTPGAEARAAAWFKQIVFDNVRAYVSGGPGRITQYDDGSRPIRPVDDFAGLLAHSRYLDTLLPSSTAYLERFPAAPLQQAEDFLYWSKEKFGLTPFITVTHVTMVAVNPSLYLITSRDVYSSRYVDASLSVTIASDALAGPEAFYLTYVNRSRANALKGFFSRFRRGIVERRTKASLDENLRDVKRRLEQGADP